MKLGIFLGYGPTTSLSTEGLGRYVGNLLKGFIDEGHKVTIGCAKWLLPALESLFDDFGIEYDQVDYIIVHKVPALWTIYRKFILKKKKPSSIKTKIYRTIADFMEITFSGLLYVTNLVALCLVAIILCIAGILFLPFLLVLSLCYIGYRLLRAGKNRSEIKMKNIIYGVLIIFKRFSKTGLDLVAFLFKKMNNNVLNELVNKINHYSDCDVWFIPSIFWPVASGIKSVRVINAPDLVTIEFPMLFATNDAVDVTEACEQFIGQERNFITYCDFLRNELLVRKMGKNPSQTIAIPHVNNAMDTYVAIDTTENIRLNSKKDFTSGFCLKLLHDLPPFSSLAYDYLKNFSFYSISYIFYASHIRPHKNILNLIKAYEYLLRRKYCNIKLILTCDVKLNQSVYDYIIENRLQFDILTFKDVDVQHLAALYKCAELVVNPTLYEGGFPFTFGEGMSVGTPSVMGNIPQTAEIMKEFHLEDLLFDPLDWKDMADKIEYALVNRKKIYQRQLPLYEKLKQRTNVVVAREYIKAFEYFIDLENQKKLVKTT